MNRTQFLDSLRRQLDDLPTSQREQILSSYTNYLENQHASGLSERDVISRLGSPADCAARARAGNLPGVKSTARPKSGNPFEPQMVAKPERTANAMQSKPQYQPDPNGKKPWAVIIIVTIAAVLCLALTGLQVLSSRSSLGYTAHDVSYALQDVSRIVVSDQNRDVKFLPLTTSTVQIKYFEGHNCTYQLSLSDGTLTITAEQNSHWYDRLLSMYDTTDPTLTVYVPPTFAGSLNISTSNGSIEGDGLENSTEIALHTTNGSIELSNCAIDGALTISSENKPVILNRVQAGDDLAITNANAMLSLTDTTCQTLSLDTTNGLIELNQVTAQSLSLSTTNASIHGAILGEEKDYSIDVSTTNGRCNLSNRIGGAGFLRANTTNGVIDVIFQPKN